MALILVRGHVEDEPRLVCAHLALTMASDSSSRGLSDSYCARVGDRICTQRIQA